MKAFVVFSLAVSFTLSVAAGAMLLATAGVADAQVRYVDAQGQAHWVQAPEQVPERYRSAATTIPSASQRSQGAPWTEQQKAATRGLVDRYCTGPESKFISGADLQSCYRYQQEEAARAARDYGASYNKVMKGAAGAPRLPE